VAWVLAVWPPTVVLNVTVDVPEVAAEDAATVIGRETPGVTESGDGLTLTPEGNPVTVTLTAPVVEPFSSSVAFCPAAPAVICRLDGVSVKAGCVPPLPLLLPPQEAKTDARRALVTTRKTLHNWRRKESFE
jgi:hypothetical protein